MLHLRVFFIVALSGLLTTSASAGMAEGRSWFNSLKDETKFLIQTDLVLVGLYDRYIDGDYGPGTFRAISAFEDAQGVISDGILTEPEMKALDAEATEVFGRLGFSETKDSVADIDLFVPSNILDTTSQVPRGTRYSSGDGGIVLETFQRALAEERFEALFGRLASTRASRRITYSNFGEASFTVTGEADGRRFYSRFYNDGQASVGFTLAWTDRYTNLGRMISIMLANFSRPLAAIEKERPDGELPNNGNAPRYISGSGFIFSPQGLIATNFHVAGDCAGLNVPGYGSASLVRGDKAADLAVIQLDRKSASHWASIRSTPIELAENVVLLGFPLADILNSSLNVATGIVSSQTGLGGNADWFTTNAGIQPGNSGGPILDLEGHVVGVAVAKIDDTKLLAAMGDTAPNVGFGINNTALLEFLSIFQHDEAVAGSSPTLSAQDVAKQAKQFTAQIICQLPSTEADS